MKEPHMKKSQLLLFTLFASITINGMEQSQPIDIPNKKETKTSIAKASPREAARVIAKKIEEDRNIIEEHTEHASSYGDSDPHCEHYYAQKADRAKYHLRNKIDNVRANCNNE